MTAIRTITTAIVSAWLSCTALADAPLVFCDGSGCGGDGPRDYTYPIESVSYPMMEFCVGTNDLDFGHYTNVLLPEGWSFNIVDEPVAHAHDIHTAHGDESPGPCWCLTKGAAHWWTEDPVYAVEIFTFGYDHPWPAEDVGWILATRREGDPPEWYDFKEFWDSPVGEGVGPLHGPASAGCPADVNQDDVVDVLDLLAVLSAWGQTGDIPEDVNDDGVVDVLDLLEVLTAWGPCPPAFSFATQLAGNPLAEYPHIEYVRAFNAGSPIHIAIDPAVLNGADKTADVYITEAKTPTEWMADPTLVDVRGMSQSETFEGATIQENTFELDASDALSAEAGTAIGRGYDLVCDFNQNAALDAGDLIDGHDEEAGFYVVRDITKAGPLEVDTVVYSCPNWQGAMGFSDQCAVFPADIGSMGEFPLVMISHGSGHQYTWYSYLQEHLASYGYIVIAHETNAMPGIPSAADTILKHTDGVIREQATIAGGVLDGHINSNSIVWIGHSRGGEGVLYAYDQIYDGGYAPEYFSADDISLMSAIVPTTMMGPYAADPHGATFHLIQGSADEYIGCAGGSQPFSLFELAEEARQSTYIHGAVSQQFHTSGRGPLIEAEDVHKITKAVYLALLKYHTYSSYAAKDFLWRQWESFRPIGLAESDTTVDHEFKEGAYAGNFVIDDFETEYSPDTSSSGGAVTYDVTNLHEGAIDDNNSDFTWTPSDPMNGMTRAISANPVRGVVFDWVPGIDAFYECEIIEAERDFSDGAYLSFRGCQGTRHPETIAELDDLTFTITLRDGDGTTSSINIGAYGGGVEEPYQRDGCGDGIGWQNEFETIRVRLTDFLHNGSGLDLTDIAAVRFDFGSSFGSNRGRLGLDDVEITTD